MRNQSINKDVKTNNALSKDDKAIANLLAEEITRNLAGAENKIWPRPSNDRCTSPTRDGC